MQRLKEAAAATAAELSADLAAIAAADPVMEDAADLAGGLAAAAAGSNQKITPGLAAELAAELAEDLRGQIPEELAIIELADDLAAVLIGLAATPPAATAAIMAAVERSERRRGIVPAADLPAARAAVRSRPAPLMAPLQLVPLQDKDIEAAAELAAEAAADAAKGGAAPRHTWQGQRRWDRENMVTVNCKLPRDKAALVREHCAERKMTRYALMQQLLLLWCAAMER